MYSFIYMKNHINLVLLSFKSNLAFKLIVNLTIVTLVNGIFSFFMVTHCKLSAIGFYWADMI